MKKLFTLTVFMFALGLVLSACNFTDSEASKEGETEEKTDQKSEQVLNLITTDELSSLDILKEHGVLTVIANTREGLYSIGKDHQPELAGATEHEISDDGLVHTFTIRDNQWSNGDPVTAHDYEYSWKRTFEKIGYYNYTFADAKILNAEEIMEGEKSIDELGIEAKDDKTLVVTLSEPNPLLNYSLAFPAYYPVNQKYVESTGDDYGQEFDKVLYNGPFVLTEWSNQGWHYQKNPDYWNADNVTLAEADVRVVKEESTAVNLYESGEVDAIEISSAFIDKYKDNPNYSTESTAEIRFLRFNHNNEALKNENIRRALDMAWDKKALTEVILKNGSVPTYYLVPDIPKLPSGESFRSLNGDFKGTMEEAKEYWQKGLEEIGKEKVELGLLTADETDDKATAEYLKDQWESNLEGLTINIELQPFQSRLELEKAIDYDISMSGYTPSVADPLNYLRMWRTGGSFNRMDYSNPEYDELVKKAESELDEEKRYELMLEAERKLFEDAAIAPMYQVSRAIIKQPFVKELIFHPTIPEYDLRWSYIE